LFRQREVAPALRWALWSQGDPKYYYLYFEYLSCSLF
jgi:hypothetical protein